MKTLLGIILAISAMASPAWSACGSQGVFVFSAQWCPACRATERFLSNYGIKYTRLETTANPQVQQFMVRTFGTKAIPVIVVDSDYLLGYDTKWLRDALCIG